MFDFTNKSLLITGGTGTFGQAFIKAILNANLPLKKVIVFSRDEYKQYEMKSRLPDFQCPVQYILGDVRNRDHLLQVCRHIDIVVHAAALKQLVSGEDNPEEFIHTNVNGTENIVYAAIQNEVSYLVGLSTDKAVKPTSLYGASKLCAEKLVLAANKRSEKSRSYVIRLGNLLGSRGSVVPLFQEKRGEGILPLTHEEMTRFTITPQESASFTLKSISLAQGGEIFVPEMPSYKIIDLAHAIAPACRLSTTGIRIGEKLHETLIAHEEAGHTLSMVDYFVIAGSLALEKYYRESGGDRVPENFSYTSDHQERILSPEKLKAFLQHIH